MKLEFNLAVKAVPMADIHVSVDCSAEELSIALADPVYQGIGEALIKKLSQSDQAPTNTDRKANGNHPQQDRFDTLRRYIEADINCLKNSDKITNKRIDILSKRIDQLFDHVMR